MAKNPDRKRNTHIAETCTCFSETQPKASTLGGSRHSPYFVLLSRIYFGVKTIF